tara:strand:- start:8917 stop:10086 length:1170 start_codon:yes stop_codon:yes gene_type:complete
LDSIGNPQKKLDMIHVAGTNGKGSTCAQISSILSTVGYKVGLYSSPHLINFNERIRVNGYPISDKEIAVFMQNIEPVINQLQSTFFEVTTAMALHYFRQQRVDIAIIETGLGGRLDSTNVIVPSITVITHISMDHMDILGEDLENIASEKAGIIKKGKPLVIANQNPIVKKILIETAKEKNAPVVELGQISKVIPNINGTQFTYDNERFFTPLIGNHQALNGALAIETTYQYEKRISLHQLKKGLEKAFWPGRLQQLDERIYYDVAHNEGGIETLLTTINNIFPEKQIIGLFCLKGDKELNHLIKKMKGRFKRLFVTTDCNGLLLKATELSEKLTSSGLPNTPLDSISEGIITIKKELTKGSVGIIFGSHYIAKEIFDEFEISFDTGII